MQSRSYHTTPAASRDLKISLMFIYSVISDHKDPCKPVKNTTNTQTHTHTNESTKLCRWQTHKRVGGGLCSRETFRKFLTWAEPEPKLWSFRYPAHCLHEKVLLQASGTDGNCTLQGCAFFGPQPTVHQGCGMKISILHLAFKWILSRNCRCGICILH